MPQSIRALDNISFCKVLFMAMDIPPKHFQLGLTKIFFRAGTLAFLDEFNTSNYTDNAPQLVQKVEKWHRRHRWQSAIVAVKCLVRINKLVRQFCAVRKITLLLQSLLLVIRYARRWRFFRTSKRRESAALRIQKWWAHISKRLSIVASKATFESTAPPPNSSSFSSRSDAASKVSESVPKIPKITNSTNSTTSTRTSALPKSVSVASVPLVDSTDLQRILSTLNMLEDRVLQLEKKLLHNDTTTPLTSLVFPTRLALLTLLLTLQVFPTRLALVFPTRLVLRLALVFPTRLALLLFPTRLQQRQPKRRG